MNPLVSVIILSYRNVKGIYETLDSVLNQRYDNIEIVISDDATPGFCDEIIGIRDYVERNSTGNISALYINAISENGGTVKNINSAIDMCNGEFVKILSAEDALKDADCLKKYVAFMMENKYLIVFGKMRGVTPEGQYKYELLSCESNYKKLKTYSVTQTLQRLFKRNFLPAPAWMARKELFLKYGKFPEDTRLIEDYPYWIYLSLQGVKFGYLDEVLIDYKLSGVSSTGNYGEMFMKDMFVIYEKYIFPYDKRFGKVQFLYNKLKSAGLNYYMTEAKWAKMKWNEKLMARIIYLPFFVFVKLQNLKNDLANK